MKKYQEANDHPWLGIDAIIQNEHGQILLLKRSADRKVYPNLWGFPSGKIDLGEEVKEAVVRECKEETGLDVEVVKFTGRYYDKKGRHPTKTIICLPHYCRVRGGQLRANEESSEARWFSPEEINNLDLAFDHKQMLVDEGII